MFKGIRMLNRERIKFVTDLIIADKKLAAADREKSIADSNLVRSFFTVSLSREKIKLKKNEESSYCGF